MSRLIVMLYPHKWIISRISLHGDKESLNVRHLPNHVNHFRGLVKMALGYTPSRMRCWRYSARWNHSLTKCKQNSLAHIILPLILLTDHGAKKWLTKLFITSLRVVSFSNSKKFSNFLCASSRFDALKLAVLVWEIFSPSNTEMLKLILRRALSFFVSNVT